MAAGAGGRADAPAPGCWASRAWSPGFLSTCRSPAQRSSLPLPQASLSCRRWRKTAPSTLPASDPRHPTHPWLAQHLLLSWLHAHLGIVPGAPLWTASVQRPRHQELGAWGARRVNTGMNEHALCQVPATRFPSDAAGRSLFGETEEEKGTEWGPRGWEERAGWGVCAPHPLLLGPARPLGRVTAAPAWGSARHCSVLRARLGTPPGPPAGS